MATGCSSVRWGLGAEAESRAARPHSPGQGRRKMTCLLIVSSDQSFASALAAEADAVGWQSVVAADVRPAMRALYEQQPEAVVLDDDAGGERTPWLTFARIREVSDTPILVFARREAQDARLDALQRGADDAVSNTCAPSEIIIRVRNQIRHHGLPQANRTYSLFDGQLTYDAELRELTVDGHSITLTPIESRLLLRMLREPDRFLDDAELTKALWGEQFAGRSEAIKVYIHRLRAKIRSLSPERSFITNSRNIGYRLR